MIERGTAIIVQENKLCSKEIKLLLLLLLNTYYERNTKDKADPLSPPRFRISPTPVHGKRLIGPFSLLLFRLQNKTI